jgi:rsbT co-antagonist protein RsbR
MNFLYNKEDNITAFITNNRQQFEEKILLEAVNVATNIHSILQAGNIDLLKNAQNLILYVVEEDAEKLIEFAKQEGIAWAKHSLTLSFKLEWVQAIRRTLWHFLYHFDHLQNNEINREDFYTLEKKINDGIDQFLNNFFISYSNYKDELIHSQRKLVEHLSVPIIPVSKSVAVLPLIGTIDGYRMQTIEEKVLLDIADLKVQTLIIDLSGIATMEMDVIVHLQKVLNGISVMGCKLVLTGIRPELVRQMILTGISFGDKVETRGTLQQTLRQFITLDPGFQVDLNK